MDKGKLAPTVHLRKGLDTPPRTTPSTSTAAMRPQHLTRQEVFADLKHIARSAQYHTLLSMTKMTIPAIIQKARRRAPSFP
jgi:hypothetical protein